MPRFISVWAFLMLAGAFAVVAIAMQESPPTEFLGQGNLSEGSQNFITMILLPPAIGLANRTGRASGWRRPAGSTGLKKRKIVDQTFPLPDLSNRASRDSSPRVIDAR
jgi:hypothetical protein